MPLLSGTAYLQLLRVDCLHLRVTRQIDIAVGASWPRSACSLLPVIVVV